MVRPPMVTVPQMVAAVIIRHEEHQVHHWIQAVRQLDALKAYHPVMMKTAPSMFKVNDDIRFIYSFFSLDSLLFISFISTP